MSTEELSLKKFNMKRLRDNRCCMVIGKTGSGKSILIKTLAYYKRYMKSAIVVSGTETSNKFFSSFIPDAWIYNEVTTELLDHILKKQKEKVENEVENPEVLLILDDCIFDNKFMKTTQMRELLMQGRHWKIFLVVSSQYVMDIPVAIRANVGYVFIFRENIIKNRRRLHENFVGVVEKFKDFNTIMDECTKDYHCLVSDNTSLSNDIEDCIFWYKANPELEFKIGSKQVWDMNKKYKKQGNQVVKKKKKSLVHRIY